MSEETSQNVNQDATQEPQSLRATSQLIAHGRGELGRVKMCIRDRRSPGP